MTALRIEPPNEAERRWLETHLAKAAELAAKYGGDPPGTSPPSLAALDRVWVTLGDAIRSTGKDPNTLINVVGIALGEHLAREHALEWSVVTDDAGTEMAVRCPTTGAEVFPTNLVGKRWATSSPAFVASVAAALSADIEILQTAAGMFDEPGE